MVESEHTLATPDFSSLLHDPAQISAQDVLKFRQTVFRDGIVSRAEAEAVFELNDAVEDKCPEWNEFFIEALTDYTVNQAEPRGYVSLENAGWLAWRISHDGVVDSASELELLVRIMAKASECPASLAGFALAQVAYAVVEGDGPLARGMKLTKGVIGEAEVELLRTILYAGGGASGLTISRKEAEILFDLNDRTDPELNHPSWQGLFVRATANYLMSAAGWHSPTRAQALAKAEWLEDTEQNTGEFLARSFSGIGKIFSEGFFDDIFMTAHVQMERAWRQRNERLMAEAHEAEMIDPDEANWLVDRIRRDGAVNPNERALLEFIRKESHSVDPKVTALIEEVAA